MVLRVMMVMPALKVMPALPASVGDQQLSVMTVKSVRLTAVTLAQVVFTHRQEMVLRVMMVMPALIVMSALPASVGDQH